MTMQLAATSGTQWTVAEGHRNFARVLVLYLLAYWSTAFILGWAAKSWKAASGDVQVVKDVF